jgi:hypothetical protein
MNTGIATLPPPAPGSCGPLVAIVMYSTMGSTVIRSAKSDPSTRSTPLLTEISAAINRRPSNDSMPATAADKIWLERFDFVEKTDREDMEASFE